MTLFLMVLKELIREQLNATSETLKSQSVSWGYNHALSLEKKNIINNLDKKVLDFEGTGNDANDTQAMMDLLDGEYGREKIQLKQEEHGKSKDDGETLGTLTKLSFHTKDFHKKISSFNDKYLGNDKLILIDKPYSNRPENIVYYHAAYYYGQEIFAPLPNINLEIRTQKEEAIRARIQDLNEKIKPDFKLEECRVKTLKTLKDLARDNKDIITPSTTPTFGIPFFSLGGLATVKVPTNLFNPSEGRFGERFSLALSLINEMKEVDFQPMGEEKAVAELSL